MRGPTDLRRRRDREPVRMHAHYDLLTGCLWYYFQRLRGNDRLRRMSGRVGLCQQYLYMYPQYKLSHRNRLRHDS